MSTQRADQPGAVVRHVAHVGDVVSTGDPVLVVETMKFESTVVADAAGVVEAIAPLGEVVAVGSTLCDIRESALRPSLLVERRPEPVEAPVPEPVEGSGVSTSSTNGARVSTRSARPTAIPELVELSTSSTRSTNGVASTGVRTSHSGQRHAGVGS